MKKRRLLSLLLAAALLFSLSAAAGAEGSLFFVAVNDTIPVTLTAQPYTSGGVIYVPYTAFDARPGGVVSAYNPTAQTFVLFTKDSRLVFDLATGETSDENQNTSTQSAIFRNNLLYIPLIFCASHFGLKVSMLESKDGYSVLRFTTGSEVYDDSLFIEKAENLIAYRVAQQSSASDPADHPQAHPDTPAQVPADDPQEVIPATVYLAFQNVDFMQENAELLAEMFAQGELSRIYIHFPDPWPKSRHAKRRLTAGSFLQQYAAILSADGILRFKTDNADLFHWSQNSFSENGWEELSCTFDQPREEAGIISEYETRYRRKGIPICCGQWRKK